MYLYLKPLLKRNIFTVKIGMVVLKNWCCKIKSTLDEFNNNIETTGKCYEYHFDLTIYHYILFWLKKCVTNITICFKGVLSKNKTMNRDNLKKHSWGGGVFFKITD